MSLVKSSSRVLRQARSVTALVIQLPTFGGASLPIHKNVACLSGKTYTTPTSTDRISLLRNSDYSSAAGFHICEVTRQLWLVTRQQCRRNIGIMGLIASNDYDGTP
jgi:hypothetical protein